DDARGPAGPRCSFPPPTIFLRPITVDPHSGERPRTTIHDNRGGFSPRCQSDIVRRRTACPRPCPAARGSRKGSPMSRDLVVSSTPQETKVAILEDGIVSELFIER